jgi:hypothetical protein
MLSANNPASIPEDPLIAAIYASISKALSEKYADHKIIINAELNYAQLTEIATLMNETKEAWKAAIDIDSYREYCLSQWELENDASDNDAYSDLDSDEYKEDEEVKLAKEVAKVAKQKEEFENNVITHFAKLDLTWNIEISHVNDSDDFAEFLEEQIKLDNIWSLNIKVVLPNFTITRMLEACRYAVPEDGISIFLDEHQIISEPQAEIILRILKKINRMQFSESVDSITMATAKKLVFSEYFDKKLWVEGQGNIHKVTMQKWVIQNLSVEKIFSDGTHCSDEEIAMLTTGLTDSNRMHELKISEGNYSGDAWKNFFTTVLGSTTPIARVCIYNDSENRLQFSPEVLIAILSGLKNHPTVVQLEIHYITWSEVVLKELVEIARLNTTLQKLDLSSSRLGEEGVRKLVGALIENQASKITELNLNNCYGADTLGDTYQQLLVQNKLTKLFLGGNGISIKTCKEIAKGLQVNTSLRILALFENLINNDCLKYLGMGVLANTGLEQLSFSSETYHVDIEMNEFFNACRSQNKTFLNLIISVVKELANQSNFFSLRNRQLPYYRNLKLLSDYTVAAIVFYQAHYKLGHAFNKMDKKQFEVILAFLAPSQFKHKQHDYLISQNIKNRRWQTFIEMKEDKGQLVNHSLFKPWNGPEENLTQDLLAVITGIKANRDLKAKITFSYFDLNLAALLAAALRANVSLIELQLSCCNLTDEEFVVLSDAIVTRTHCLHQLNLDLNSLTLRSIPTFEKLIVSEKVREIMIFKNEIFADEATSQRIHELAVAYGVTIHVKPVEFFAKYSEDAIVREFAEEKSERRFRLN